MSRYAVNLDELLSFADRLAAFNRRAEEIAAAVDQEIVELHGTWLGQGVESEREYHETWLRLSRELRESADFLRESASLAHRNYTRVGEVNCGMWP
ncbi:WXG100 family type VII secretion target [Mycobacterium crocinum]|uniref:WXG100 family type VII secretion target n=1 Tax=Mycolicibacterium crocinum TaxID=388459 RepID=A0ABY3TPK3_9MYCO|nr:WXG100 family type VII secretion target [Mycolicibacterium crocinum]MCV7216337.1 WXG100 family type VII secretion target [Mycolicibacterium crocinum]ULN41304.1 WXG100 family type VII secretion target [Mycolicibacterium crocinum]